VHHWPVFGIAAATCLTLFSYGNAYAEIDLRNASVERLDNGLTLILLEDRNFPVVSTQMLYRVGARDESYGQTGIAHFLEHMAFRDSENFPDTGLVSSIYAIGGEWHGYTWTDQTTYFATVPKEHLDLLLRIEADRLTRLRISKDDMEAERGAVLAEMHMYENYPSSMLLDAVMFTSFLAHPYRNNTIGWESDIENLKHEEVVTFYKRHYQPANAVLAIVGDFESSEVRARVDALFADVEGGAPTPMPHTIEPLQEGERRITLYGDADVKRFMIGYRAPAASHPDFATFLVLQEILGAGSGVNFRQNDWGVPVNDASILDGAADDLTTWYPPSAQDYIFIVGGTISPDQKASNLERVIEDRITTVRDRAPDQEVLNAAIENVLDQLIFDVETTEDAAHQLAFFSGLHALDILLELPQRVGLVTAADVQRVASTYLRPERRTIGWHLPGEKPAVVSAPKPASKIVKEAPKPIDVVAVPLAEAHRLSGGIPVIIQQSDVSRSAYLQVVLPVSEVDGADFVNNDPVWRHSSVAYRFKPDDLADMVAKAREAIKSARAGTGDKEPDSGDPETRLEQVFAGLMSGEGRAGPSRVSPGLIVVSGDVEQEQTLDLLEKNFGDLEAPARASTAPSRRWAVDDIDIHLDKPVAQAQLGYIVPAPGPTDEQALAYRILLYILSHDYEGRLGKEAISNRGLAYYIDSRYRSDGGEAWITLSVGVDPAKVTQLKTLLKAELRRLQEDLPTNDEIEEAKRHLVGRARSGSQSNEELAAALAEEWLWYGELLTPEALAEKLDVIDREDVIGIVTEFIDGATIVVDR
jgi:predicted Zn-dependent peptidase